RAGRGRWPGGGALVVWGLRGPLPAPGAGGGQAPASGSAVPYLLAQPQPAQLPPPAREPVRPREEPGTIPGPRPTTKGGLSELIGGFHPRLEGLPPGIKPPLGTTPVPPRRNLNLHHP